jgi:membrane protein YdbS with pleckstrin-like domain
MGETDPTIERQLHDVPPAKPVEEDEVIYFEGRPVFRADQVKAVLTALLGLSLLVLAVVGLVLAWWAWWVSIVALLLGILAIVVPVLVTRTTRYRITNYRIDYERGILKKRIDTLELWHVDDISFEQGLLDRMMNVGCIKVLSNDRTTPKLDLHGLPNPRAIFDALRQRVITVKRQRGVIKMDVG